VVNIHQRHYPERVLPGVERLARTMTGTQLVINVSWMPWASVTTRSRLRGDFEGVGNVRALKALRLRT
jgi:hypothetical protein